MVAIKTESPQGSRESTPKVKKEDSPAKASPSNVDYSKYRIIERGINSQGNRWDTREYTLRDGSLAYGYHYSNRDQSYFYQHPDGATYYNNGKGGARYTKVDGSGWEKQMFTAHDKPDMINRIARERQAHTPPSTAATYGGGLDDLSEGFQRMSVAAEERSGRAGERASSGSPATPLNAHGTEANRLRRESDERTQYTIPEQHDRYAHVEDDVEGSDFVYVGRDAGVAYGHQEYYGDHDDCDGYYYEY